MAAYAGYACPMPVIMAKKEIETNHGNFVIIVDNPIAVENLKKLSLTEDTEFDGQATISVVYL